MLEGQTGGDVFGKLEKRNPGKIHNRLFYVVVAVLIVPLQYNIIKNTVDLNYINMDEM